MRTRVIPPDPRFCARDHWLLSVWIRRVQRMTFQDPRLGIFDCHCPDEQFCAPVHMYESVPLFALDAGTPSLVHAEHDHEGRGGFTVEANLDHVITNVVPDGILSLLDHAREGGGDVADPEALHTCPICLDDMTSNCELVETHCKHVFHIPCIVRWFKMSCTCPICRCGLLEDNI
ncbi:hypothetical protein CDL15_Pgr020824 [Punica granatum]|nr:hypothetical protein CDL15_Pgr020824 [Punica granatum]